MARSTSLVLRSIRHFVYCSLTEHIQYPARAVQSFHSSSSGNIAMVFAFMSGLLFLFVGGAVDYTRWNAVRADMVESMDAASLAVAQRAASDTTLTDAELTAYGEKFFKENFRYECDERVDC